nr:PREDICTED: THAP domain-containing protein 5-like [Linepithema humile]
MPSCSAKKCTNSWKKHFKMCYFPLNDPQRCAIWVANMNRENWTPNKHSALCEVHFTPEMWENNRQDNLLKLKRNAVPTLFRDTETSEVNDATFTNLNENQDVAVVIEDTNDNKCNVEAPNGAIVEEDNVIMHNISKENISNKEMENEIYSNSAGTSERKELMIGENTSSSYTDNSESYKKQFEKLQKHYIKLDKIHKKTKIKLKNAENRIKRLTKKKQI